MNVSQLFKRVVTLGAILIGAIAVVGGVLGYLLFGANGLLSAVIGAAMAALFVTLTAISVWFGSRLSLAGFFGVVLGGWLAKLVVFLVLVVVLRQATFVVGSVLFLTLVAAIIGSLAVDTLVFLKSRLPIVNEK
ncbi:MAG: hypothetical protein RL670_330 [Actinomycetota bacterium]|jgi:hypothetical protein